MSLIAKARGFLVPSLLISIFSGCAVENYQSIAIRAVEHNSLAIQPETLQKRIEMSKECNATGKTIDALASFGYFVVSNDSGVVVKTDANISKTDEDSSAFSITKLYERGYKIEAKRQGMELLSSGKSSFSLLVSMARIYEAEGDYRGATLFYIDALNFEPKNESANYALARLYYLQKKSKQAMRQAKIALSIDGLESKNIKDLMEKIDQMKDMSNE